MIFLQWHLGLGDAILCNGLVRELAKTDRMTLPSYPHNLVSVKYMFRDLGNVEVVEVKDDEEMIMKASLLSMNDKKVVGLGYFSKQSFDLTKWDQEFYRHAGVPFECRWKSFKADMSYIRNIPIPYAFVHQDVERSFSIKHDLLPKIHCFYPHKANSIFYWSTLIMEAEEVHVINSSFLCLADSLPLKAKRKVLHQYARPDGVPPTLKEGWEILT